MSIADSLKKLKQSDKPSLLNLLKDGCDSALSLSGAEFYDRVAAVAAYLSIYHPKAKTIGLIYPSGGFLIAPIMLGCIAAGCTVAPMKVPKNRRKDDRASSILTAADLDLVILPTTFVKDFEEFSRNHSLNVPSVQHETLMQAPIYDLDPAKMPAADHPAVVQFTSGSTGNPKGVELSLDMIEQNCRSLAKSLDIRAASRLYNWMPFFHDFGLIFGLFLPVFMGCRICIVDPMVFVQDPNKCFHGLEKNAITHTAFASFALEHCVFHARNDGLEGLDLSRLQKLLVGADMIQVTHAEEFASKFAPFGFPVDALVPGYGLAEATLAVTVGHGGINSQPINDNSWQNALPDREAIECGYPVENVKIRIQSIDTANILLSDGEVGEVLVSGPSVIGQYRKQAAGNSQIVVQGQAFFPTGDIGFIRNSALYICGRLKELLIINGENFTPTLIEDLCLNALGLRRTAYQAGAFVFVENGMDRLGLAIEVPSDMRGTQQVIAKLEETVLVATDLSLAHVNFFRKGTLPKTSSGKLMRQSIADQHHQAKSVHARTSNVSRVEAPNKEHKDVQN